MKLRTALAVIVVSLTINLILGCVPKSSPKTTTTLEITQPTYTLEEVQIATKAALRLRYFNFSVKKDMVRVEKIMENASGYLLMYMFTPDKEVCSICYADIGEMAEIILFRSAKANQGKINLLMVSDNTVIEKNLNFLTEILTQVFHNQKMDPSAIPQFFSKVNLLITFDEELWEEYESMSPPIFGVVEIESGDMIYGSGAGKGSWVELDSIIQEYEKRHPTITE